MLDMRIKFSLAVLTFALYFVACSRSDIASRSGADETSNGVAFAVIDSMGRPVAHAIVRIRPSDYQARSASPNLSWSQGYMDLATNDAGQFWVDSLPAGSFKMEVISDSFSALTMLPVKQSTMQTHTIALLPSVSVRGFVQLPPGVSYAQIVVLGTDHTCVVDSNGFFELSGLPSGTLVLKAYLPNSQTVIAMDSVFIAARTNIDSLTLSSVQYPQSSWQDSSEVIVDTRGVVLANPVLNFPLQVDLIDSVFPVNAQMAGADLRVYSREGKAIPFEIAYWDPINRRARLYILLDTVNPNDSVLAVRIKWNRAGALAVQNAAMVFDSMQGWAGVWHLVNDYRDARGVLQTANSVSQALPAVVHGGMNVSMQGAVFGDTSSYIALSPVAIDLSSQNYSMEFWLEPESEGGTFLIRNQGVDHWDHRQKAIILGDTLQSVTVLKGLRVGMMCWGAPTNSYVYSSSMLTLFQWSHIVIQHQYIAGDSSLVQMYLDGNKIGLLDSIQHAEPDNLPDSLYLGLNVFAGPIRGTLHDLSIAKVLRNDDWIALRYWNQQENSRMVTVHVLNAK